MKNNSDPLKNIFSNIKDGPLPTEVQKKRMLEYVLSQGCHQEKEISKAWRWIEQYPWRIAFGVATVQTIICTLIFGTGYTNIFLSYFGG